MLLAVSAIMLTQLDAVIGEVTSAAGRVHPMTDAIGITALLDATEWWDWSLAQNPPLLFIAAFTVVHALLVLAYGVLGWRLLGTIATGRGALRVLLVAEAVELLLLVVALSTMGRHSVDQSITVWSQVIATAVATAALAKWIAVLGVAAIVLIQLVRRAEARVWIRTTVRSLRAQRLSLLVLVFVASVTLVPGAGVLEQLADVQRGWAAYSGFAWMPFVFASLAFAFVGSSLFVFGRFRAGRYLELAMGIHSAATRREPSLVPWIIVGLGVPVLALAVATGFADPGTIDWGVVAIFSTVVLVGLVVTSRVLRSHAPSWIGDGATRRVSLELARRTRVTGDVLAGLFLATGALSLVRAFTTPAILSLRPESVTLRSDVTAATSWALLLVGVALSLASFVALRALRERFDARIARSTRPAANAMQGTGRVTESRVLTTMALAAVGGSVLLLVAFLFFPAPLAGFLEPVATLVAIVGAWSIVVASLILLLDERRPLPVFRLMQLRSTPLLSLLVLLPVALSQLGGPAPLHAIAEYGKSDVGPRSDLPTALREWADANEACSIPVSIGVGDSVSVLPLVLGAAEGGGMRAAAWTSYVYRDFLAAGDCRANSVFLSSGVSGGSIGLSLFRDDLSETTDPAETSAAGIGEPEALATVLAADLVGDLFGSLTGIRVPTAPGYGSPGDPQDWSWQDSATLMQAAWRDRAPQLAQPYDLESQAPTGYLVFNATDAISKCKVLISQLDLNVQALKAPDGVTACNSTDAELPDAIDLKDYYRDCPFDMDWATAATLSSRFSFITPAGRIPADHGCGREADLQLIDGGYADNSGLGTLSDLTPSLTRIVTSLNASAEREGRPFIVPIVMYLSNEPGLDVAAAPTGALAELEIPLSTGFSAPLQQVAPATWLTRITAELSAVCPVAESDCEDAVTALRDRLPQGVVIVAPNTNPSVGVPLGWALSDVSRTGLTQELAVQRECNARGEREPDCPTRSDYARLGDLFDLLSAE